MKDTPTEVVIGILFGIAFVYVVYKIVVYYKKYFTKKDEKE